MDKKDNDFPYLDGFFGTSDTIKDIAESLCKYFTRSKNGSSTEQAHVPPPYFHILEAHN